MHTVALHCIHHAGADVVYPRLIYNFQEVTTVADSIENSAVFSFEIFIKDSNNLLYSIASDDIIDLHWTTVDNSSKSHIRIAHYNLTKLSHNSNEGARYRFKVNSRYLGDGPLLLTLSAKVQCISYSCTRYWYSRCSTCNRWRYEGQSETIQIGAKKGRSGTQGRHPFCCAKSLFTVMFSWILLSVFSLQPT